MSGLIVGGIPNRLPLTLRRWNPPVEAATADLFSVAAPREDLAYAVGGFISSAETVGVYRMKPVILMFDGVRWNVSRMSNLQLDGRLFAVSCGRFGVCIAVGEAGTILRLDYTAPAGPAATWSPPVAGCTACNGMTLRAVWVGPLPVGDNLTIAWAVGDSGKVVRWDYRASGDRGIPQADAVGLAGGADLFAISASSGNVYAAGRGGILLWRVWGGWQSCSLASTSLAGRDILTLLGRPVEGGVLAGLADGSVVELNFSPPGSEQCVQVVELRPASSTSAIFAIAPLSMRFCGYYPHRQNCISLLVATNDGVYSWPDQPRMPSWSRADISTGSANVTFLGVASVPSGALRLALPPPQAEIVDFSSGAVVATVPLLLRSATFYLSGEELWAFDFSSVRGPAGLYTVRVAGIGTSPPFAISPAALDFAAYTTARALYYQRCGFPGGLVEPYADRRFARPACHVHTVAGSNSTLRGRKPVPIDAPHATDAGFHWSLVGTPMYAGEVVGAEIRVDAHGGHHDAGDFNRYIPSASELVWYLLVGLDIAPEAFTDDSWDIPESGNGIPDILDELRWEVEALARMAGPDGGAYHKISSCDWFLGMPHREPGPRYLFQRTTHDTASLAALLASASRAWRRYDPILAAAWLEQAERAWSLLERTPETPSGGFKNPNWPGDCPGSTGEATDEYDSDNRLRAAAELYRTTNREKYHDYVKGWFKAPTYTEGNSGAGLGQYPQAFWAYFMTGEDWDAAGGASGGPVPALREKCAQHFIQAGKSLLDRHYGNPYFNAGRLDVADWIGWGVFSYGTRESLQLLQAWVASGRTDRQFFEVASRNIDSQLGANPQSASFITGIGLRSPMRPTCVVCDSDEQSDPLPGLPVFGPFAHLSNGIPKYATAQHDANNYPYVWATDDAFPILRRYVDDPQMIPMSEYTVATMAHTLVPLAILSHSGGDVPRPRRYPFDIAIANRTHVEVSMAWPLARTAKAAAINKVGCEDIFDTPSLAALGAGAVCTWPEVDGGWTLLIKVGTFSRRTLTNGTILRSKGASTGFSNANTDFWVTSVVLEVIDVVDTSPCSLFLSWEELVALRASGEPVLSGGLGELSHPPIYMVWTCVENRQTSGDCGMSLANDPVCFRFHEVDTEWDWLGSDGASIVGISGAGCPGAICAWP